VPNEVGLQLDVAERDLRRRRIPYRVLPPAQGLSPAAALRVCASSPTPRTHLESGTTVRLIVARSCG
jgi:hypothetical protein